MIFTLLLSGLICFFWESRRQKRADEDARARGFANAREEQSARFFEECQREFERRYPQSED